MAIPQLRRGSPKQPSGLIDKAKLLELHRTNNPVERLACISSNGLGQIVRNAVVGANLSTYVSEEMLIEEVIRAYFRSINIEWNFAEALGCACETVEEAYADDQRKRYEEEQIYARFQDLYGELSHHESEIVNTLKVLHDRFIEPELCNVSLHHETPNELYILLERY